MDLPTTDLVDVHAAAFLGFTSTNPVHGPSRQNIQLTTSTSSDHRISNDRRIGLVASVTRTSRRTSSSSLIPMVCCALIPLEYAFQYGNALELYPSNEKESMVGDNAADAFPILSKGASL
jgi:hypothetical protein